jgi:hypothetical protein
MPVDAPGAAIGAGGEFVMHRRARQLRDAPARIVEPRENIALVEEEFVFLVEPAQRQQSLATERAICAQKVRKFR